jgi:hypothetical protein
MVRRCFKRKTWRVQEPEPLYRRVHNLLDSRARRGGPSERAARPGLDCEFTKSRRQPPIRGNDDANSENRLYDRKPIYLE